MRAPCDSDGAFEEQVPPHGPLQNRYTRAGLDGSGRGIGTGARMGRARPRRGTIRAHTVTWSCAAQHSAKTRVIRITPQGAADAERIAGSGCCPQYASVNFPPGAARVPKILEILRHTAGQDGRTPITVVAGLRSWVESRWATRPREPGLLDAIAGNRPRPGRERV